MIESEPVQNEDYPTVNPAEVLFQQGTLSFDHQGRQFQLSCEIKDEGEKPIFIISYGEVSTEKDPIQGSGRGVSKEVAFSSLSYQVKVSIQKELAMHENTLSTDIEV